MGMKTTLMTMAVGDTGSFQGDGEATDRFALTSVETAEVYIGVCPVDINTGCKTTEGRV